MSFALQSIFSFSILLAGVIGLVRWKKIVKSYRPFIVFTWIALLNELVSYYCIRQYRSNAVNSNIYILVEFIILVWLFRRWSLKPGKNRYLLLLSMAVLIWIADNLVVHSLRAFNTSFSVFYSLVVIFFSINRFNHTIMTERKNLFSNARFLICITFIIYFTYKAIVEVFYIVHPGLSDEFYYNLFLVLVLVNLFSNLMYALATAWIPTRQKFMLPY